MSFPSFLESSIDQAEGSRRLLAQRCSRCATVAFPVSLMCSRCGNTQLDRQPLTSTASIYSWTVIHRSSAAMRVPYLVALAEFPEGPRLFAQLEAPPENVHVGMPVEVAFGTPPAGSPEDAYYFVPAAS